MPGWHVDEVNRARVCCRMMMYDFGSLVELGRQFNVGQQQLREAGAMQRCAAG